MERKDIRTDIVKFLSARARAFTRITSNDDLLLEEEKQGTTLYKLHLKCKLCRCFLTGSVSVSRYSFFQSESGKLKHRDETNSAQIPHDVSNKI